jgi:hypothetical protein
MLSDLGHDLRYACRTLLRSPVFAGAVILTLALWIGANAIIFRAVDAVLLRDAPVADPDRVVDVYTSSGNNPFGSTSYPDYFDLRDSGIFQYARAHQERENRHSLGSHGLLAIGFAIGLSIASAGTRYIEAQLFGVTATDPLTFGGVCLVLASAGLAACLIPAWRAMRVDPIVALRRP